MICSIYYFSRIIYSVVLFIFIHCSQRQIRIKINIYYCFVPTFINNDITCRCRYSHGIFSRARVSTCIRRFNRINSNFNNEFRREKKNKSLCCVFPTSTNYSAEFVRVCHRCLWERFHFLTISILAQAKHRPDNWASELNHSVVVELSEAILL